MSAGAGRGGTLGSGPGDRPRVGVSSCLLGERVRYDGGHRRNDGVVRLGRYVEWMATCPEMEAGLGTPRPPIRLEGGEERVHARVVEGGRDVTGALEVQARRRLRELRLSGLDGFVLKARSPSCGLFQVPVLRAGGRPERGTGLFAARLQEAFPLLPLEEEAGLEDGARLARFVELVFAHRRLRALLEARACWRRLCRFHERHRLALEVHGPAGAARLRALITPRPGRGARRRALAAYARAFMEHLARPAARRSHHRVLVGVWRQTRDAAPAREARRIEEDLRAFARGACPRGAVIRRLRRLVARGAPGGLGDQVYLHPSRAELRFSEDA